MTINGTTAVGYFGQGNFGENLVIASETLNLANSSHANNAPLCTMQTLSGAVRTSDTTSLLTGLTVNWTDSAGTPTACNLKLLIFSKTGVPSTVTVGTALAALQADADYLLGIVDIPLASYYSINEIKTQNINCNIALYNNDATKGQAVYWLLVNSSGLAFTPSTNEKINIQFAIKQN